MPTPFIYDNVDDATRAQLSSGPARMAIDTAGLDATTSAIREAVATGRQADGTIRLDNSSRLSSLGRDGLVRTDFQLVFSRIVRPGASNNGTAQTGT